MGYVYACMCESVSGVCVRVCVPFQSYGFWGECVGLHIDSCHDLPDPKAYVM